MERRETIDIRKAGQNKGCLGDCAGEIWQLICGRWGKLKDDRFLLMQWLNLLQRERKLESGGIPEQFVFQAVCKKCGDILIDYPASQVLDACPWCFASKSKETVS